MKNLQKGFVVPFIVAVVALLVVGGGYYFYSQKTKAPAQNNLSDISDWKTCTNSQYGFQIKYPNSFIGSVSEKAKAGGILFYGENPNKLKLEGYFYNQFNPETLNASSDSTFKKSEISVAGIKSYKTESISCKMGCGSSNNIFIPYKNGAIVVGISRGDGTEKTSELIKITDQENKLLDQIISTFKFTDSQGTSDQTKDWKTYTNTPYGFSIKYPNNLHYETGEYPNLNYWYIKFTYNNDSTKSPLVIRVEKSFLGKMSVENSKNTIPGKNILGVKTTILTGDATGKCQETFLNMKNWSYIFGNYCGQDKLFDTMISTFQFTK
jgi:hypothetical protein